MTRGRSLLAASSLVVFYVSVSFVAAQTQPIGKIEVDLDRAVDLSVYGTYAWSRDQVPVQNLANHLRLINAIQDQMKTKGFRIDTVKPDVYVQYRVERHSEVRTHSTQEPSVWDRTNLTVQIDLSREETVTLGIQLVEAESSFPLWRVTGTYPLGSPDRSERQIKEAVADLFSRYPEPKDEKAKPEKKD